MGDAPITIRKYTDFDEIKADEYRYCAYALVRVGDPA